MGSTTCPKCGAREKKGNTKSYSVWACGTTNPVGDLLNEARYCLRRQLATMTARAEKAEAEVVRLREAIEERDGFARYMGWVSTCTYCVGRSTHHTDCPTVTHPAEVEP